MPAKVVLSKTNTLVLTPAKGTYSTNIKGGGTVVKAPVTTQNIALAKNNVTPMKSVFSNNAINFYKKGSLTSGIGSVRNARSRGKKT